jgi:hypothetical protein
VEAIPATSAALARERLPRERTEAGVLASLCVVLVRDI